MTNWTENEVPVFVSGVSTMTEELPPELVGGRVTVKVAEPPLYGTVLKPTPGEKAAFDDAEVMLAAAVGADDADPVGVSMTRSAELVAVGSGLVVKKVRLVVVGPGYPT